MTIVKRRIGLAVDRLTTVEVLTEARRTEHHPERVREALSIASKELGIAPELVVERMWDQDLLTVEDAERALHYLWLS